MRYQDLYNKCELFYKIAQSESTLIENTESNISVQNTVPIDGKTSIKLSGDLSSPRSVSNAISGIESIIHKLMQQAKDAEDGKEYPVELEIDLREVTAINEPGVGVILGILRLLYPHMPYMATVNILVKNGSVSKALDILGRLESGGAKELGISIQKS